MLRLMEEVLAEGSDYGSTAVATGFFDALRNSYRVGDDFDLHPL